MSVSRLDELKYIFHKINIFKRRTNAVFIPLLDTVRDYEYEFNL